MKSYLVRTDDGDNIAVIPDLPDRLLVESYLMDALKEHYDQPVLTVEMTEEDEKYYARKAKVTFSSDEEGETETTRDYYLESIWTYLPEK